MTVLNHPLPRAACAFALLACGTTACGSAATAAPPRLVASPPATVQSRPGVEGRPTTSLATTRDPAGSVAAVDVAAETDRLDGSAAAAEAASDPRQKEALALCQSAAELIARGERERAIPLIDRAYERLLALAESDEDSRQQASDDIRQLVAKLLRDAYGRRVAPATASLDLGLPIVDNEYVRREIASFTTIERDRFLEAYRQSGLYRPMILKKLAAAHMPSQLSWLPMVESWFKVKAYSPAGAVGMWQFIASTGLRYGLTRDEWVDQRIDPERATDAAIAYLGELHGMYGDWPKALAAYNCGEGRVLRLQEEAGDYADFWDLFEQLPGETRRYFPRFVATLLIVQDPKRYGMTLPEPLSPQPGVGVATTARSVALGDLEAALGVEQGTLRELNPELRHGATPPVSYALRVPQQHAEAVGAKLAELPEWNPPRRAANVVVTHRVQGGQSLRAIARRYGTTVAAIQKLNRLRTQKVRAGQRLRIPTVPKL